MELKRSIGVVGLTCIGVGGVVGSGWLFAPINAAQHAGPAAMLSWIICGVAVMLLALTFAEVCTCLPVAGGLGRIPYYSHGQLAAAAMGWTAWLGYVLAAPIEVTVMLQYLQGPLPWLSGGSASHGLSYLGIAFAIVFLAIMTVINAFGAALFAKLNAGLTVFKVIVPIVVAVLIIADRFQGANFTTSPSFAPMGWEGVLSAIPAGGVLFAFLGFRHAIDMAGEVRRPQVTMPVALGLSVLICLLLYLLLQVSFIGALSEDSLAKGWAQLESGHQLGPLGALAVALGMVWLSSVILAGAVIAPFGGALVATGSNARITLALARNGFFPKLMTRLSERQVPLNALLLNLALGIAAFLALPFQELVALNSSAITLSLTIGPIALLALRYQMPEAERGFRLPLAWPVASLAFIVATLVIYWSGWDNTWRLVLALALGGVLFTIVQTRSGQWNVDARSALWLVPYLVGLTLLSWLGGFGGGLDVIPFGWDILLGSLLAMGTILWAVRLRLDRGTFSARNPDLTTELEGSRADS
ncbi:APC family permease [Fodinicurvata sediminis]|uniref:APC family permease n=1 Tax=Fodinicurvata sediminis TaxID=1121832 RepID=UPI0003B53C94|nr:APC family permease [Fodinicurvata sediminis]